MIEGNTQCNGSMIDGVEELEHILKQKTFTRQVFVSLNLCKLPCTVVGPHWWTMDTYN